MEKKENSAWIHFSLNIYAASVGINSNDDYDEDDQPASQPASQRPLIKSQSIRYSLSGVCRLGQLGTHFWQVRPKYVEICSSLVLRQFFFCIFSPVGLEKAPLLGKLSKHLSGQGADRPQTIMTQWRTSHVLARKKWKPRTLVVVAEAQVWKHYPSFSTLNSAVRTTTNCRLPTSVEGVIHYSFVDGSPPPARRSVGKVWAI